MTNPQNLQECTRCGRCCLNSPCQIPVVHIDALRYILVNEFGKPKNVGSMDIVEVMFRYKEDILPTDQVHGYFMPLPKSEGVCMWLKKEGDKYHCTLFWNKTADILVGFPEQVIGKGKGCTLKNPRIVPVIPMVYRNHERAILTVGEQNDNKHKTN